MKRHDRFDGRRRRRVRKAAKAKRVRQVEWLEPRHMMAATPLASVTDSLAVAGQTRELELSLAGNDRPIVLTLEVRGTGGTFDPGSLEVKTQSGAAIRPLSTHDGVAAKTDRINIQLAAGDYDLVVRGTGNTTGAFQVLAYLAGDESGNQQVSQQEYAMLTAAMLQNRSGINAIASRVFARQGVDVSQNLYRAAFDLNANGRIDEFDHQKIGQNVNAAVPSVTFGTSQQAPTIQASLSNDTGRSNTDGITNDVTATISGSISDDGTIESFTASIDGGTAVELGTLLGQNFSAGGNFALTLAHLEQIAGTGAGSLVNSGMHTLRLTARDDQGGMPASPVQITFAFDTIAPPAPTTLDLAAASDTGPSNSDNITSDTTPTIGGNTEANSIVQIFSSLVSGAIGQVTASGGTFSVTTSALSAGTHNITARATDVAGNVSAASAALAVTIDTTPPAAPTFDLAPESDTGTVGDHLTTSTSVILRGTAEANAGVALRRGGTTLTTGTADASGAFEFTGVSLPFGASQFEVVVTDLAGLTSSATRSITRNNAPVAEDAMFTLVEESAAGTVVGSVSATDPNTTEGDVLRYAITAGNTSNAFVIDADTGEIRVSNPAAIDFETIPTFTLTVTVTDTGGDGSGNSGTGLSDTATITINLTDANDAPTIVDQSFQVDENSADETIVGDVEASDPNVGDTITYAITGGNTGGAFAIDPVTGQLRVANSAALNFEATPTFSLTVTVTDEGSQSRSATITVNLQNVNEAPQMADQGFPVSLGSVTGQPVGNLQFTDPDAGDSFEFEVVESDAPSGLFVVDPATGAISIGDPAGLSAGAVYTLTVRITDQGGTGLSDEAVVTLTVASNAAPVAAGDVFQVIENSSNNALAVVDNDTDPNPGDDLTVIDVGATEFGGTAVVGPDNRSIQYTPAAGFVGTDRFSYTLSDGSTTVETMVTVQVLKAAPNLNAHIHANLQIYINGVQQPNPPASIGVDNQGNFLSPMHTHDPDGRLHIHPTQDGPPTQPVTLGDFFTTWRTNAGVAGNNPNAIFTNNQVMGHVLAADEVVRMYVNGLPVTARGEYIIRDEDQIVISVEKKAAVANSPTLVPIAETTVLGGSPLLIPLEGFDFDSRSLTFMASSSNPSLVATSIFTGNRSLLMSVEGYGQLTYELFENLVPGITEPMISLVESGILDNTLIHRVINGFVFQGLDPTGTGSGFEGLLHFDDQYHPDLQHNTSGLLSMAKSGDDTNSSQVFSTDVNPEANANSVALLRRLDFNHSIFARQTSGENVRRQLMAVTTGANDRPTTDVVVEDVEIVQIGDKAVLMLKAPEGASGEADITVTARDAAGNTITRTFHVNVTPDTFNGTPFFSDTPKHVQTTVDTPVDLPLEVFDVEGDPSTIQSAAVPLSVTILWDNTGDEAGLTPVGTTTFSHFGSNWNNAIVVETGNSPLAASGTTSYRMDPGGGQVAFDRPIDFATFYFAHGPGQAPFQAIAFDANNSPLATVNSRLATRYNDPDNFFRLDSATPIARIYFSGGYVDNFQFVVPAVEVTLQINQDTDTVTVTPPSGFVGTLAVGVAVRQASPAADTVDPFDIQVIRITVLPASTASAVSPPEDEQGEFSDAALDIAFEQLGAA